MSTEPLVEMRGVHKSYGAGAAAVHALRGVDLELAPGELVVVSGRSGAGKSTLLGLLAGFLAADAGTVRVAGTDLGAADAAALATLRRGTIGVIQQDLALLPMLTAAENVEVPLRIVRADPSRRDARVLELLGRVGLAGHAHQRPDEMSGGQQQRVAIARALANGPLLLLADEPTAQLDSETAGRVMDLLRELVEEQGLTVLVATHDPVVEARGDRVLHLQDGQVQDPVEVSTG
ncbi:MAG TPA: ABC transporter ATP-binding protein [Nocardioides sp.]|nr:ABC transporter ATP-binding protein [Nocardioides sp.]